MTDGDLISELYAGCFRRLVVQLYAVTGDLNEAQDAVQEAFTKALAAPRRFARLDSPEAWLRVRQPPLDDLWSAGRARRRQRSAVVAVVVVVALFGMAAVPLMAGPSGTNWADPDGLPGHTDRATELHLTGPDSAVGVGAIDYGCTLRFTHTEDAGLTWTDWDAARYTVANCGLDPSGGGSVVDVRYSVLGQRSYLIQAGDRFQLSTDYGRTWQDEEQAVVAVPAFPAQARPVFCQGGCGALRYPVAVDPSTGTVYRLTGQPPSAYRPFSLYPSPDGAIWATYWPGGEGAFTVVARSADRGATWNSWRSASGANVIAVAGVDVRRAYLLIEPLPPAGAPSTAVEGPSELLGTVDGGVTWTAVGTDLPNVPEGRPLTIGSDGSLMVTQSGYGSSLLTSSLLVSGDGGRHFKKMREYARLDGGVGVSPGYAWLYGRDDMSRGGADHVLVTSDGSSWTRFTLPD